MLTINNTGDRDLIVENIYIVSQNSLNLLTDLGDCYTPTIPPGGSCSFSVTFNPTVEGSLSSSPSNPSDMCIIVSNDPDTPELIIPFLGKGTVTQTLLVDTGFRPSIDGFNVDNGTFYENVLPNISDPLNEWDEGGSCMAMSIMSSLYYLKKQDNGNIPGLYEALEEHSIMASALYLMMPEVFKFIFQSIPNLYIAVEGSFAWESNLEKLVKAYLDMLAFTAHRN